MRLYHFTSPKHIHSCLGEGLTKGHVPKSLDPPRFESGWQWLTMNGSFQQSWNVMASLDYDRTAYRIEVDVHRFGFVRNKLYFWTDVADRLTEPHARRSLNERGDPENWVLFKGVVRPRWFADVTAKEGFPSVELADPAR